MNQTAVLKKPNGLPCYFFSPFRGVYSVPNKANWQIALTVMAFYPQPESSRISSKPNFFFFTICLQSHYRFTPPAETGQMWASCSPELMQSRLAWCSVRVPGKGRVWVWLGNMDIVHKPHLCPGERPGQSDSLKDRCPKVGVANSLCGKPSLTKAASHQGTEFPTPAWWGPGSV